MADWYELQLALDLPDSLKAEELAQLRWHLGEEGGRNDDTYEQPLLHSRGPARRIGGVLIGELHADDRGWALTARQEVHPDEFHDLSRLVRWLGARTTTTGPVGHLRFYETDVPELLLALDGSVHRATLRREKLVEPSSDLFSDV